MPEHTEDMATMKCDDVRDAVLSGRTPTGADLEHHLEECEGCAALLAEDRLAALLRHASRGPGVLTPPVIGGPLDSIRSLATPMRVGACATAVVLVGAVHALGLLRTDSGAYPGLRMAAVLASFTIGAVLVEMFVLRPIHLPRPDRHLLPVIVAAGILLTIGSSILPPAHAHLEAHPESFAGQGGDFWPRAIACLIYGTILGLPALALLWLFGRGGGSRPTTVLGGLTAAALAGNVALQLHCPLVSRGHLLVGHAGIPIALLLVGLPVVLRRRRGRGPGRVAPSGRSGGPAGQGLG